MQGKIINDPVYGFIRFPEKEMMQLIDHPWFQRLRNIRQMGTASYVYPGAVHTRFHHSLGAAHLMQIALSELRIKGIDISEKEVLAARQAILLHDIGHGPFSHALEFSLIPDIRHEDLSKMMIEQLNAEYGGQLDMALDIFEGRFEKPFLHQLVSSQLDMDRMDYLNRDSFYTGVSEGVIGYHRILQMLTIQNDSLVVEEKGIHSVEKFIIARRLMYWQVYLHKTVLSSEQLIIRILKRAKELARQGVQLFCSPDLAFFLYEKINTVDFLAVPALLHRFCNLNDDDITLSIKAWQQHEDNVLSKLSRMLVSRKLYKAKISNHPLPETYETLMVKARRHFDETTIPYFLFTGITSNNTYNQDDEQINILMKTGDIRNISEVENALINTLTSGSIEKHFICYVPELVNDQYRCC
ncbi:MAG TPA: HD domain-containing protein [Edaphocola sp.]|nr:HD domain-containing protein [Edaphocola sp.]